MGLFIAKSKKSIGIFLLRNISLPQKIHPKSLSIKLNGAFKVTNTINNMKQTTVVFLWPFQINLSHHY
uniref:Uncharacterized protein n=1 Tax=Medicago truncatula TaxID=3880 RepID=I3SPI6_MEDTR|nr:unknown [Medicago truncatula]